MSTTAPIPSPTFDPTIVAPPTPPRSVHPPGSKLPPLLQALRMARDPLGYAMAVHRRYGEPFTMEGPGFGRSMVFSSPELIKPIVTGDPNVFHAGLANQPIKPVLGPWSLLALDRAPHMQQRKLLLPPFHGERLRSYAGLIAELAEREVADWPLGEPFRLQERMESLTLEVILEVVFGIADEARKHELRRLLPLLVESGRMLVFWGTMIHRDIGPIRPQATFEARRDAVDALLYAEIADRRAMDPAERAQRHDILSMLVEAEHEDGTPMGDAEIRDQLATLVLAGHETTATALTWAIDQLHRNPAVLARLRSDPDDAAYLDAVCREVLRIRPVVPMVGRTVTEPVRIGDRDVPAGTSLAVAMIVTHHREDVYAEPARFRPERFLPSAGTEVPSYAWLPFGGGVRRCIGASFAQFEMATILRVLASGRVRLAARRPEPLRATGVTIIPGRGVPIVRER